MNGTEVIASTEAELVDTIKDELSKRIGSEPRSEALPILFVDDHRGFSPDILNTLREGLAASGTPVIIFTDREELQGELSKRGMSDAEVREKLTALTQGMRSDAEFKNLAEVVRAMPAYKAEIAEKGSKRPALPKNRKRDRWN